MYDFAIACEKFSCRSEQVPTAPFHLNRNNYQSFSFQISSRTYMGKIIQITINLYPFSLTVHITLVMKVQFFWDSEYGKYYAILVQV